LIIINFINRFFGPTNIAVTLKLIKYSLWMILFPLGTFYFLFYIVFKRNKDMLGWCGIAAVIAANIVIYAYVRMAWYEDREDLDNKNSIMNNPDKKRTD
jgi:hypothetical protein